MQLESVDGDVNQLPSADPADRSRSRHYPAARPKLHTSLVINADPTKPECVPFSSVRNCRGARYRATMPRSARPGTVMAVWAFESWHLPIGRDDRRCGPFDHR
jgi:hypothetical protein